ncbi:MAG: hypothetical protein E5W64_18200, partial [Mesorhizobium sp.]
MTRIWSWSRVGFGCIYPIHSIDGSYRKYTSLSDGSIAPYGAGQFIPLERPAMSILLVTSSPRGAASHSTRI